MTVLEQAQAMTSGRATAGVEEAQAMTSGLAASASVALDIGAGRGALIIYPGERFRGREIEISRAGEERRVHTGVHERRRGPAAVLTAIFGSLPAGDYAIWESDSKRAADVIVPERAIAEVVLP